MSIYATFMQENENAEMHILRGISRQLSTEGIQYSEIGSDFRF